VLGVNDFLAGPACKASTRAAGELLSRSRRAMHEGPASEAMRSLAFAVGEPDYWQNALMAGLKPIGQHCGALYFKSTLRAAFPCEDLLAQTARRCKGPRA
jgi:hypothetical protein